MDVISSLPDEMLTNILSSLSTKEAVQTCILSKRWRDPWCFMSVLKFDIKDWVDPASIDEEQLKEGENKFETFLNGMLDNRGSSQLEKFEYKNVITEYESEVSLDFLDRVALLKPRVVSIDVHRWNKLDFPELIFSCSSLEKLILSVITEDVTNISPTVVNLPSLKTLELQGIELCDNNGFLQKILLGCPALENLFLMVCNLDISELSSDFLKKMNIDECLQSKRIQISCPRLVSLVIGSSNIIPGFELKYSRYLEYANFHIELEENASDMNLLRSVSNVSHLNLGLWSPRFKEKLENEISQCRTFSNLKVLELEYCDPTDMALVVCFLKHSPCLEELTLYLDSFEDDTEEQNQGEMRKVSFQREYLETLRILKPIDCEVAITNKLRTHVRIIKILSLVAKCASIYFF